MKVLLIGDASNCHWNLAQGLRQAGHEVTVASHGSRWMDTRRNIDISRRPGKLGGAILWLKLNTVLRSDLRGYDVVQISNPIFLDLRPEKNRFLLERLKRDNGALFLTMLGTDSQYVSLCRSHVLRYNEWFIQGKPTPYALQHSERLKAWESPLLMDHTRYVYDVVDGVLPVLYEYYKICEQFIESSRLAYMGLPIDLSSVERKPIDNAGPLRIMAACHQGREVEKGFDLMMPALRQFQASNPDRVILDFVQNVPFEQFQKLLDQAHIIVDQLYSYTPATTALMAMARGKVVVSGGEPEYYDFIGENKLAPKPIINAHPLHIESLQSQLQTLLDHRERMTQMAENGIKIVEKDNSMDVVTKRAVNFWTSKL